MAQNTSISEYVLSRFKIKVIFDTVLQDKSYTSELFWRPNLAIQPGNVASLQIKFSIHLLNYFEIKIYLFQARINWKKKNIQQHISV